MTVVTRDRPGEGGGNWLAVHGLTKTYGSFAALSGFSAEFRVDQITGIAGPNGAGKTTLLDAISGYVRMDAGEVVLGTTHLESFTAEQICQRGVARTFQTPTVLDHETVFGNVLLAAQFGTRHTQWCGFRYPKATVERAQRALAALGLDEVASKPADLCSMLERKSLMLATALATNPRFVLLDEPCSGLAKDEIQRFLDSLGKAHADLSIGIVIVEHVLSALSQVADRLVIMHSGRLLADGPPTDVLARPDVAEIYLGSVAEAYR